MMVAWLRELYWGVRVCDLALTIVVCFALYSYVHSAFGTTKPASIGDQSVYGRARNTEYCSHQLLVVNDSNC